MICNLYGAVGIRLLGVGERVVDSLSSGRRFLESLFNQIILFNELNHSLVFFPYIRIRSYVACDSFKQRLATTLTKCKMQI